MMTFWIALAVLLLAAAVWVRSHRRTSRSAQDRSVSGDSNTYHCVAIDYSSDPCAAVKKIEGQRFLSAEAPMFPLPGCTSRNCQCRYVHYDDRRARPDRRDPWETALGVKAVKEAVSEDDERRETRGRRSED
jgi:hypothetical protein